MIRRLVRNTSSTAFCTWQKIMPLVPVHFAVQRDHLAQPGTGHHPDFMQIDDDAAAAELFDQREQFMAELFEVYIFGQQLDATPTMTMSSAISRRRYFGVNSLNDDTHPTPFERH